MIYFVQDDSLFHIKIGFTSDVEAEKRMAALQTGSAAGLTLLLTLPGDRTEETRLHNLFADAHVQGEWFKPTSPLLQFIVQSSKNGNGKPATGAIEEHEGRRVNVREATVRTMSVQVKSLTIANKQVTLSVFRQLQQEQIVDAKTLELRGIPWGKVNYFWGPCAERANHLHIVWQKGEELRRCCLEPNCISDEGGKWHRDNLLDVRDITRNIRILDLLLQGAKCTQIARMMVVGSIRIRDDDDFALRLNSLILDSPENTQQILQRWRKDYLGQLEDEGAEIPDEITEREMACKAIWSRYDNRIKEYEAAWKRRYHELEKLDHLFIAV